MNLYAKFWFATQFWIKPEDRRPYTFIFRDYYHEHPIMFISLTVGISYWLHNFLGFETLVKVAIGILLGHLFWSVKYKPDEQEEPEYLGD